MSKIRFSERYYFVEGLVVQLATLDAIERQSVLTLIDVFLKKKKLDGPWLDKTQNPATEAGLYQFSCRSLVSIGINSDCYLSTGRFDEHY